MASEFDRELSELAKVQPALVAGRAALERALSALSSRQVMPPRGIRDVQDAERALAALHTPGVSTLGVIPADLGESLARLRRELASPTQDSSAAELATLARQCLEQLRGVLQLRADISAAFVVVANEAACLRRSEEHPQELLDPDCRKRMRHGLVRLRDAMSFLNSLATAPQLGDRSQRLFSPDSFARLEELLQLLDNDEQTLGALSAASRGCRIAVAMGPGRISPSAE